MRHSVHKWLIAGLVLFGLLGIQPTEPLSANSPSWWNASYSERSGISISTVDALPSGYTVFYRFNHAGLVAGGDSLASGDDVRVLRYNGTTWTELDRVLAVGSAWNTGSTEIAFRLQAAAAALTTVDQYYLYYGNPSATAPPANELNVYVAFDNFDSGVIDTNKWTVEVEPGGATPVQTGGQLQIAGTTTFWGARLVSTDGLTGPDVIVEATIELVAQTTNAQTHAEFSLVDQGMATIYSDNSSLKRYGWKFFTPWADIGPTTLQGESNVPVRVGISWTSGTSILRTYENGQLQATRTSAPNSFTTPTLYYHPSAPGTFDVRFDDYVVRKWVLNPPVVSPSEEVLVVVEIQSEMVFIVGAHVGACNGVAQSAGAAATATTASFGRLGVSGNKVVAQDLQVTTNAQGGVRVYAKAASTLTRIGGSQTISAVAAPNTAPAAFPVAGNEAFGYTTSDSTLSAGTTDRFTNGGAKWAALSSTNREVLHASGPSDTTECIAYQVGAGATTEAGVYQTTVVYTALPLF